MSSKYLFITGSLLVLPVAQAADPAFCSTSLDRLSDEVQIPALNLENPEAVVFEVGALQAEVSPTPRASMTGGILLRRGDKLAGADSARYDPDSRALLLDGSVRYEDAGTQVESDSAEFSYGFGRIRFEGAKFSLGDGDAHGDSLDGTYLEVESRLLERALLRAGGNKSEAARMLGLKRTTFLDKLRRHGLEHRAVG